MALLDLGEKYIMSREGTIITKWDGQSPQGLLLVTGLSYADLPLESAKPDQPFAALMQVLAVARKDAGPLSLARLKRIEVDRDLGITLHADGPVETARLGFYRYTEKYARIGRLLGHLNRQTSDPPLKIVEVESDSRIVAGPFPEALQDNTGRRS